MSVRLYVGNLPQSFDAKELEALFSAVGEGVRFKAVQDRETGASRGFGFANVEEEALADQVIEQLNGRDFGGNNLRIERSERRDPRSGGAGNDRRPGAGPATSTVARKAINKVVHSDTVVEGAPDPRWSGELAKLKALLADQKAAV
jgi:RNA recognition motif-containing protein